MCLVKDDGCWPHGVGFRSVVLLWTGRKEEGLFVVILWFGSVVSQFGGSLEGLGDRRFRRKG